MRIAVTGMSAWSCFGRGPDALLAALAAGRRGLGEQQREPGDRWMRTSLAMTAGDLPADEDPWEAAVHVAVQTAADAFAMAGVAGCAPSRLAVANGTTQGSDAFAAFLRARIEGGRANPSSLAEGAFGPARRIAGRLGARGPVLTISTACSSGLNAIGQAARLLESRRVDCAVAGGVDLLSFLTWIGFNSLRALSPGGCRPLDEGRDGMSLGDGAAYVVLERLEDAERRGAPIRGVLTGYGCGADGFHATAPDPEGAGAIRVMRAALSSDASPADLTLVSAHGTGTPANDAAEVAAIQIVADELRAPGPVHVVALKSQLGHTLGAAGALEVVAALCCLERRLVPGTAGLSRPLAHRPPLVLPSAPAPLAAAAPLALCNSFGFGGAVAALALRGCP